MLICGDPFKKSFSKPYCKIKGGEWFINVIIDGKKTSQTMEFDSKELAETYSTENNKIFVNIHDGGGNILNTEEFDDMKSANDFVVSNKKSEHKKINKQEHEQKNSEITFFEKIISDFEEQPTIQMGDESDAGVYDNSELKSVHATEFNEMVSVSENKARSLLMSVAQLYVDKNMMDQSDYIKFKMVIEEKGLSSLVYQLDIARKSLFKLSEQIQTGMHSPRNYEVLTGLQRIVLDVTKYLHEHLGSLQESFKTLAEDLRNNAKPDENNSEIIDTTATVLETKSRSMLIDEIKNIIKESKAQKTPQSHNDNLKVDNDDEMGDAIIIKHGDDEEEMNKDASDNMLGLDTV